MFYDADAPASMPPLEPQYPLLELENDVVEISRFSSSSAAAAAAAAAAKPQSSSRSKRKRSDDREDDGDAPIIQRLKSPAAAASSSLVSCPEVQLCLAHLPLEPDELTKLGIWGRLPAGECLFRTWLLNDTAPMPLMAALSLLPAGEIFRTLQFGTRMVRQILSKADGADKMRTVPAWHLQRYAKLARLVAELCEARTPLAPMIEDKKAFLSDVHAILQCDARHSRNMPSALQHTFQQLSFAAMQVDCCCRWKLGDPILKLSSFTNNSCRITTAGTIAHGFGGASTFVRARNFSADVPFLL